MKPCRNAPEPVAIASTTFLLAMTAPSGAYPLESPLAVTRMSGARALMFDGEVAASAAHARHDFIGDEKHAVRSADFRDRLQVSRWGNDCT